MRKAFIILTGILFTLLFATCTQFTADIDGYLSYWASEAYITDSSIKAVLQNDLNSIPSVPSAEDVSVTFKLKNPKSFPLDLPPAADPAKKVIVFEHLTQAPAAGTDYTLTQSEDRQSLTLTYKASFLQAYEWGAQDLSSTLSLYAVDGRPFKQIYTLKLKANTPPQNPSFTVAKTTGSPAYYVLCITIPDMDKRVPGGLLHKDLARIEVNGTSYSFSVNEAQKAFTKPESDSFITHSDVAKLSEPDADEVPTDGWVLYYKTDVEVKDGAAKKDYTVRLADAQGLVSGILNASTKPNKAENETIRITKGTKISGSGSEADPIIIGTGSAGAELTASSPTANTTVHCTVSEIGGSTPVKYDGNPVTVPLPLNGAGEKLYKLEYYTDGEGFAATPVKTIYYKVVQGHTVTYLVDGGNGKIQSGSDTAVSSGTVSVLHGGNITFTAQPDEASGYEVDSWTGAAANTPNTTATLSNVTGDTTVTVKFKKKTYPVTFSVVGGNGTLKATPEGGAENLTGSITVEHGTLVTFTATPTDPTHYKVGDWTCEPSEGFTGASGQANATLTVTAHTTVSVQFVELNALTSTTFKIHGQDASAGSVTLPYAKAQVTKGDIELEFSGHTGIPFTVTSSSSSPLPLNLTPGTPQDIIINVAAKPGDYPAWSKTVSITRAKNSVAKLQSFTLNGETKTAASDGSFASEYEVASETATVAGFTFATGSDEATASVTPEGNVSIPEDTGKNFTITVKAQDGTVKETITFTVKRKKYDVTYRVEIVDEVAGGKIEDGSSEQTTSGTVSVTHGDSVTFTAHPTNTDWKVAEWKRDNAEENGTNGTYTISVTAATTVTVKFYQSTLKNPATWKDLARAVKSAPDNATLTINGEIQATDVANNESRIKVKKNLTIKGENNAVLNARDNKGIFDAYKTLTLQDITLKNSKLSASYSGGAGVYVNGNGTLIMKGSSVITECSAVNSGGGVYVGGGTFEMHDSSTITGCSANEGGGVYVSSGTFKMHGTSAITDCSANEKGGGVYVQDGTFKMQDSAIVTPKADTPGKQENDVYLESGKTITVDGTLSNNPVARITPREYTAGHSYLTGSGVGTHHLKFTVPPEKVTEDSENWNVFWYIADNGNLKAEVEDPVMLQMVITGSSNNTIIKLGNISDLKTVEIWGYRKIMLKADRAVTLTCPKKTQNDYKHLQVQEHASLILKGPITLQGTDYDSNTQYALYVEYGGKAEIKDGVTITGFKNGNIGPVVSDGNLTMSGGEISGNKAKNGGGVYIHASWRYFTMTGGTIKGKT